MCAGLGSHVCAQKPVKVLAVLVSVCILILVRKTFIESGANVVASRSSNNPVSVPDSAGVTGEHNYIWV